MEITSWVEFQRLLDKIESKDIPTPSLIDVQRKRLGEPDDYDLHVRTGLRYGDYTLLTATIYHPRRVTGAHIPTKR